MTRRPAFTLAGGDPTLGQPAMTTGAAEAPATPHAPEDLAGYPYRAGALAALLRGAADDLTAALAVIPEHQGPTRRQIENRIAAIDATLAQIAAINAAAA